MFDEISERNVVTWSAMIGLYGRCEEVFELFERMVGDRVVGWVIKRESTFR